MRGHRVMFVAPYRAELEEYEVDPASLRPHEALIAAEYSVISAGTEGASYTDLIAQMPPVYGVARGRGYPRATGYAHLGRVIALGPEPPEGLHVGDRILTFSNHASPARANVGRFFLKVPPEMDGRHAVFTRMAGVAVTALRGSSLPAGGT